MTTRIQLKFQLGPFQLEISAEKQTGKKAHASSQSLPPTQPPSGAYADNVIPFRVRAA